MRIRRSPGTGDAQLRRVGWAILAALAAGLQAGCTREFYREWANQDVSEAIFEKSRDPRWRLDIFSIEPPALSRFADPYDQDAPPAPPDDVAAEALSPVPQWPSNRLITPAEGTGYWELLEYWKRQDESNALAEGRAAPVVKPNAAVVGLPRNLGAGGFPTSLSTDPASRPGIPFQVFPGMADPYHPGGIIEPNEAIDADQPPGATALPIENVPGGGTQGGNLEALPPGTGGTGTPGGGTRRAPRGGMGPGPGGVATPTAPGSPYSGPSPLSPGSREVTPPRLSPGSQGTEPVPGGQRPVSPGSPGASARVAPRRWDEVVIPVVRLQDGPETGQESAAGRIGLPVVRRPQNSGAKAANSTPISVPRGTSKGTRPFIPPPRVPASRAGARTPGIAGGDDRMVARAAFQQATAGAQPGAGAQPLQPGVEPPTVAIPPGTVTQPPPLPPMGPGQTTRRPGTLDADIQALPPTAGGEPLDQQRIGEVGRMTPAEAKGLADILVPRVPPMNESEAAGLPKDFKAYRLDMQKSWLIALINARYYQYQLEQLYINALPVTLQRFAFEPQFYAGLSPVTGVPQGPIAGSSGTGIGSGSIATATGLSTANSWTYATRFAPTGQVSTMNVGTVAGMGKAFNTGGQLLLGFANELVFNFAGKTAPYQPTVLSSLPVSFTQPLLRGGGRAVILEPLTNEERTLLYNVRSFAQFRQQFFVVTLTGGTIQNFGNAFPLAGFSSAGNTDPTIGYIPAAFNVVQVEIDRRNVAFYENLVRLYRELIQGESSGLSQLQVDQVMSSLISARQTLFNDKITYRYGLDQFKMQIGMPPDIPIILDQKFLGVPFYRVFDAVDNWQRRSDRNLNELPGIIGNIPQLQDIDIDGRSVLGIYRNYRASRGSNFVPEDEDGLEDQLQAAVRVALEYRLDLMNDRASLYDAWRQIRVTANTLKGIFNVTLTNNVYTGPYSTNPFAFMSQARNFSLVLNAELPLVRVNERNNFRAALINYQRARRSLMSAEDNLKIQLRQDLRLVHQAYIGYEINKRNYELNVRLKDQAFEQIVAPPAGGSQGLAQSANAATQTTNLLSFQRGAYGSQVALITGYETYQTQRLIFYRDIGTLPYDEWEAFRELFPTEYFGPVFGHADNRAGLAGGAEAPPPPGVPR